MHSEPVAHDGEASAQRIGKVRRGRDPTIVPVCVVAALTIGVVIVAAAATKMEHALELSDRLVPYHQFVDRFVTSVSLAHDDYLLAQRARHRLGASARKIHDARHGDANRAELVLVSRQSSQCRIEEQIGCSGRIPRSAYHREVASCCPPTEVVELHVDVDLAVDVDVMAARLQSGLRQRLRGPGERPGGIDQHVDAVESASYLGAIVEREHAIVHAVLFCDLSQPLAVARREDHPELARCLRLRHVPRLGLGGDQATGIASRAV